MKIFGSVLGGHGFAKTEMMQKIYVRKFSIRCSHARRSVSKLLKQFFHLVDCELEVPDHLRKMLPVFANTNVCLDGAGDHMLNFATEIISEPRPFFNFKHEITTDIS